MGRVDPTRRLLFWLKAPFAADAVLAVIGVLLLIGNNAAGWWVLLFAAVRAVIGVVALWIIAPRVRRRGGQR